MLSKTEIGKRILAERLRRGMSQKQVGEACGLSQNGVGKIELGRIGKSRYVADIWRYLGLPMGDLDLDQLPEAGTVNHSALAKVDECEVFKLSHTTKALLIQTVKYEQVFLPTLNHRQGGGTGGILVTWEFSSGQTISGVYDASLIERGLSPFLEKVARSFPEALRQALDGLSPHAKQLLGRP